jgi:HSP20 family protein
MASRSFDDVDRMFEQMDRLLEGMWDRVSDRETGIVPWPQQTAFDLHENDDGDGYVLVVDLPGFERDEIEIRATDTHVHIDASHESADDRVYDRREARERFAIPADVDVDEITASYHNGVLELELPADRDAETGHRIDVE